MSDFKECTLHGKHTGDTCPRCDEISKDSFTRCKIHGISYPKLDAIGCPGCEKEGLLTPNKVTAPHISLVESLSKPIRLKKRGRNNWSYRGLTFDSRPEALRYGYLADLQSIGVIRHLCVQPKSIIRGQVHIGKTRYYKKATLPSETYTPDYAYIYDGMLVIEDVKGIKKGKPYSKPQANRSHKHLMKRYEHKLDRVLFMLVTHKKGVWSYYQASTGFPEISISFTEYKDKVA